MLAQNGAASFENTLCKGYTYFGPKSWITLLYRINVTIVNMSVIWFNEDITPLQRHHTRPKWSWRFWEHSLQMLHIFWTKPWFTILHRINLTISNISVIWFNEDIPRLQRHHARLMWSCLFREHSLQRFHKFRTKIVNHTFAQDKCDNSKYECYLV